MALKVIVKSIDIAQREGTSRRGQPYKIRSQDAYIHTYLADGRQAPYPERFALNLEDGQEPYPVGEYTLDTDPCIYVGDFGRLTLGRPRLVAVTQGVKAAA